MAYGSGNGNSSGGKLDWRGCEDGTPSSSAKTNPRDNEKRSGVGDWRGDGDSTPASSPKGNR